MVINGGSLLADGNVTFRIASGKGTVPTGSIKVGSVTTGGSATILLSPLRSDLAGATLEIMYNTTVGTSGWVKITGVIVVDAPFVQKFPYPLVTNQDQIIIIGAFFCYAFSSAVQTEYCLLVFLAFSQLDLSALD